MNTKSIADEINEYSENFHAAIGRLVMEFGYLEFHLDSWLKKLAQNVDTYDATELDRIFGINDKIKTFGKLITLHSDNARILSEKNDILDKMRKLKNFRHRIFHGSWNAYFVEQQSWQKLWFNKKTDKIEAFNVTVDEVINAGDEVLRLQVLGANLTQKILAN